VAISTPLRALILKYFPFFYLTMTPTALLPTLTT